MRLEFGDAEVRNCFITGNTATHGGGIATAEQTTVAIVGCTITDNEAYSGGGLPS